MTLNIPSYIITMQGVKVSETLTQDCLESCGKFNLKPEIFPAIHGDAINHEWNNLKLKDFQINKRIKKLNSGGLGCTISHMKLWKKCIEKQSPILILEHDAIMLRPIPNNIINSFNDVCNLDWLSRKTSNYDIEVEQDRGQGVTLYNKKRPPYSGLELYNKTHIKGAHAYIIKPSGAQKLIDFVWAMGVLSADVVINSVSCELTYSDTSYFRINKKFWDSQRMKAKNSFTRPTSQDKLKFKMEKNV